VPGAFELTVVAEALARKGAAAFVCLGMVIKGATPHFEYVCEAVSHGLTHGGCPRAVPVRVCILTCDDDAQARDRAGLPGSREDKGREAVEAALATALVLRGL